MIPDPRQLSSSIKKTVEAALKELSHRQIKSAFDEIKCADRRRLGDVALEASGFAETSEREATLEELYKAGDGACPSTPSGIFVKRNDIPLSNVSPLERLHV